MSYETCGTACETKAPQQETLRSLIGQITNVLANANADASLALEAVDGEGPKNPLERSEPFTLRQHLNEILARARQLQSTLEVLNEIIGRNTPSVVGSPQKARY